MSSLALVAHLSTAIDRGAIDGPALSSGPAAHRAVPPADRLALEPGSERAGSGAGHRLRAALDRRDRAPLQHVWTAPALQGCSSDMVGIIGSGCSRVSG